MPLPIVPPPITTTFFIPFDSWTSKFAQTLSGRQIALLLCSGDRPLAQEARPRSSAVKLDATPFANENEHRLGTCRRPRAASATQNQDRGSQPTLGTPGRIPPPAI